MTDDDRPDPGDVPPEGTSPDGSREITVPTEIPFVDGRVEIALSGVLILFGVFAIVLSQTIREGSIPDPIGSGGFPVLAGAFLVIVGILQVIRQVRFLRSVSGHLVPCPGADTDEEGYEASAGRAFAMFAVGFGWALTLPIIGFLTATTLLGVAGIVFMGVESWWRRILVPLVTACLMWLVFDQIFGIQFPRSPVEEFLDGLLPTVRI